MNHPTALIRHPETSPTPSNHGTCGQWIDRFESITLDQCNAMASMQDRVDTKYLVGGEQMRAFLDAIRSRYTVLEIESRREFRYSSCYYDDNFGCYFDHHQGRRKRLKVRTREYVDGGGMVYFEIKRKGLRGRTVKHRCSTDQLMVPRIQGEQLEMLRDLYSSEYKKPMPFIFSPALLVDYQRCTLVATCGGERVTVDSCIDFAKPDSCDPPTRVSDDFIIIETKSGKGKGIADSALRSLKIRPVSKCSKYCLGANLTHSVRKGNVFLPTIRRAQRNPVQAPH